MARARAGAKPQRRASPRKSQQSHPIERLQTGIPRLDFILNGGLLRGGTYALFGPPGAGKTIFANQLCFNYIDRYGGNCVYLTLLVESHARMLKHLGSMQFFEEDCIGERLYYISGYEALRSEGVKGLMELVRRTLAERKPGLLVVDGIESIQPMSADAQEAKEFLHELQAFATLTGATTLMCAVVNDEDTRRAENPLVDGVIELSDKLVGPRAVRELTVHKFRGSNYLRGRHEVEITDGGIQIHPRTEVQFNKPPEEATESRIRMALGVPQLDRMLEGGLPSGSACALLGAPGAGKTTLGLSFLVEGARRGEHGLYFGFYEPPPRLMEKAESLGLPLQKWVDKGLIELTWQPPLEHFMDSLAEQLLEKIRSAPRTRRRLFIDGVEGFRAASVYADRLPRFLSALTNQLRMFDVTSLIAEELPLFTPELDINPELANVAESVILLRYVELKSQLYRLVSIMKMRESRYDTSIREFRITGQGIEVRDSFESAEAILSGHARIASAAPATRRKRRGKSR